MENGNNLKEDVKQYYGDIRLPDEQNQMADKLLQDINKNGFKEDCQRLVKEKNRTKWHVGSLYMSKAAVAAIVICVLLVSAGLTVFALIWQNK